MQRAELPIKVPISAWLLVLRINRKLEGANLRLKKSFKNSLRERELGRFYVVDRKENRVKQKHVNIEELAKELKCLEPWEQWKGGK